MGRELRTLGARLVWDCALLQRKPINHQPDRRSWEAVPLLRTVRPPLLKTLPEWGLCIYLGGVLVLFFLLFFFFSFPSVSLAKPTAGFGVFLFCYASCWVGRPELNDTDRPTSSQPWLLGGLWGLAGPSLSSSISSREESSRLGCFLRSPPSPPLPARCRSRGQADSGKALTQAATQARKCFLGLSGDISHCR